MLFTQFEFIFVFLPITFAGYFLLGAATLNPLPRMIWLAGASLVFYAYWDVRFLPVIAVSVVLNYAFGYWIAGAPTGSRLRRAIFIAAIAVNLGAIAYFKYVNFGIAILNSLFHHKLRTLGVVLPLGISFFTFTQIAYLADVFGGYATERNFAKYALFVSYFPHLVAGPILHHKEMMPQFGGEASRHPSGEKIALGLSVFAIGLVKKVVVADGFSLIVGPVFQQANTGAIWPGDAWGGALAYSLQIYFDFSGYSDMAVGLSLLFGIVLPFNFDSPYKARSIAEFWRRWHITLSRFLRDYVYIPLGGNRRGESRRYLNVLATMILGGLWHGAGWTFLAWGTLHGLFLVVNHAWLAVKSRWPKLTRWADTGAFSLVSLLITQIAVVVAWVYFRADGIHAAHRMLKAMAGSTRAILPGQASLVTAADLGLVALGYAACLVLPNVIAIFERWRIGIEEYHNSRPWSVLALRWRPSVPWALTASALLMVGILVGLATGNASPFLYFQF